MGFDKIAIIVSQQDPAGLNIKKNLIDSHSFTKLDTIFGRDSVYINGNTSLYTATENSIDCNDIDKEIEADLFIFATKHQSSKGVHSLSVHAPGNWGPAEMGGKEGKLCISPASYIKEGLKILQELAGEEYVVTVEQTHHGPIIDTPCFFIEIGSSEAQWKDPPSGALIAQAITRIIEARPKYPSTLLLGGGHYNNAANKILLRTDYAIGHICAKHCLEFFDEAMLKQAIERTNEKVECVILDWKGLGQHKSRLIELLEKNKIEYKRSKNLY